MITLDILNSSDEINYDAFLNKFKYNLIQYYPNWSKVITSLKKDQRYFLIAKENNEIIGVLPLYHFKCDYGDIMTTTSYHTMTGLLAIENKYIIYKKLLEYSINLAKELNCTALSISSNPFINDNEYYLNFLKPDYIMENFIQYIAINEIFDDKGNLINHNYLKRSNLSRNIKKAYSSNLQCCVNINNTIKIDNVYKIYKNRMNELKSLPLPKEIFVSINKLMKDDAKFCTILKEGNIISNAIYLYNDNIGNMYTLSQCSEYKNLLCNYLLTFEIMKWSSINGLNIFNWMSSPKKHDGVYKWKEQWGSKETNYYYYTKFLSNKDMDIGEDDLIEIKKNYRFHYLAPFNLLMNKNKDAKYTTKDEIYSYINRK